MAREAWAIVAALAAHALLLRAASRLPAENPLLGGRTSIDAIEIDLDEVSSRSITSATTDPPKQEEPAREDPARASPSRADGEPAAPHEPSVSRERAENAAPAQLDPPSNETSSRDGATSESGTVRSHALPAPGSADEYGDARSASPSSASGPVWSFLPGLIHAEGEAAPTTTPRADAVDSEAASKVVSATLRSRDASVGISLPATQVVVGAISQAVRSSGVPHNTRATFEVKLGPGGQVVSSRLVSASGGDPAALAQAAQAVATSLASKHLEIGSARSATIRVSTTMRHVFPAGTTKAADVKPVCANQFINDLADGASRTATKDPESSVPIFTDEHGRPCIPVGISGISDVANIGATKQIQVLTTTTVKVDGLDALPTDIVPVSKDPVWVKPTDGAPRPVLPYTVRKRIRDREKKK